MKASEAWEKGIRVRINIDDPGGRFHKGEEGVLLENDFPKYYYKVLLAGEEPGFLDDSPPCLRIYYFYKDEVSR